MELLSFLLLAVFVISALLLIVIVMMQDEGGEGLGGIFGGGGSGSQVGNRSGNILTKTTSVLGAIFFLSAFGVAWLNRTPEEGDVEAAARRLEGGAGVEWWLEDEEDLDFEDQPFQFEDEPLDEEIEELEDELFMPDEEAVE